MMEKSLPSLFKKCDIVLRNNYFINDISHENTDDETGSTFAKRVIGGWNKKCAKRKQHHAVSMCEMEHVPYTKILSYKK